MNVNYDSESKELGGSVTGGYRAGAALAAKAEVYREPSSTEGNQASIAATAVAEASAEVKVIGGIGVSGQVTAGVKASTKDGVHAEGPDASGSVSRGSGSVDSSGRTTYAIGGGIGAAAGGDVTVSGNVTVGQKPASPPPPTLDVKR